MKYGIIGDGRIATHLGAYLRMLGQETLSWSRRGAHGHGRAPSRPADALGEAEVILVAVSDSQIEPVLLENPELRAKPCVHFSGSMTTGMAYGAHPLMTFATGAPYARTEYESMAWVCEAPSRFKELFPSLPNPSYEIPAAKKALYHALCVAGGNFTTMLWREVFERFERELGLPREAAYPYLERAAANVRGAAGLALTGPLARGDRATIERNLSALGDSALADVYRSFLRLHQERNQ